MANSMIHWNGDQVAAIDTETTGLNPFYHEMIQFAIIPLDSNFNPRKDVLPLCLNLKPDHPERASPEALKVNGLSLTHMCNNGLDREKAADLFEEWVEKLQLPFTPSGIRKKVCPLGQNYGFDRGFILDWLGYERYDDIFTYYSKDTAAVASFMNDRAAMHHEKVPFAKNNLLWLANTYQIEGYNMAHDALQDALACSKVYKCMVERGLFLPI